MDKIRINLFGIGCRVIKGQFNDSVWERFRQVAKKIKSPIDEAFFDLSFFDKDNICEYDSWYELGNLIQVSGLMNHYQSVIEIRINGMKANKILFQDLLVENVLFPLYKTTITEIQCLEHQSKCVLIVEKEIGTVATFQFESDNFLIDKLAFHLNVVIPRKDLHYVILSKMEYDGKNLIKKKSDTLVRERFAMID